MQLDRVSAPVSVCTDPQCRWASLSAADHHARHARPCGRRFLGIDGRDKLCELPAGHEGGHRGQPYGAVNV